METEIFLCVLELLHRRQSLDDKLINTILRALIVRIIQSNVTNNLVSEEILSLIQLVDRLDYGEGITPPEATKAAYCAVAVDCAVRILDESEVKEGDYLHVVERIWKDRFREMWKLNSPGLILDELSNWKVMIEAVRQNILTRDDVVEAVRVYVAEQWERVGPFLTTELDKVGVRDRVGERVTSFADEVSKKIQKGNMLHKHKLDTGQCSRGAILETGRGVELTHTVELDSGALYKKYDCPPSTVVNKVQEVLRSSSLQLQDMGIDTLPEALNLAAETLRSCMQWGTMKPKENQNRVDVVVNTSFDKSAEVVQANEDEGCSRHQCCSHQVPSPSLMAQNSNACTSERDCSIDNLAEGSLDCSDRKILKRRKTNRWSLQEEENLRIGVKRHGVGNWKLILKSYPGEFVERTQVDLKDKWRNMTRYKS